MRIYERLQLVCKSNNLKLKDFIEITGLPYRTGQSYLNGTREPNAEGMQIICTQMRINMNWLLTGEGAIFIDEISIGSTDEQEIDLLKDFRATNDTGKKVILSTAKIIATEMNNDASQGGDNEETK